MIKAFPKIFTIGQDYIRDIFEEEVEITEKIDGSQWVFGRVNGELYMRSKGRLQITGAIDKMFKLAEQYVENLNLPEGKIYYCEFLNKPRHNVLEYGRVPKNNLILFGIGKSDDTFISDYKTLKKESKSLDIEVVPLIFKGKINNAEEIKDLLKTESILGEVKIEGIVVKNYQRPFLLGGRPIPLMAGKFVSEEFKEVHKNWSKDHTAKGKWETFKESFCTEARWQKAVQHLKENGELENSPRDIGKLIIEIKKDIGQENKEEIKKFLWKEFGEEVLRSSTKGMPEWYKNKLLEDNFK